MWITTLFLFEKWERCFFLKKKSGIDPMAIGVDDY
jgi:hypothetical protein